MSTFSVAAGESTPGRIWNPPLRVGEMPLRPDNAVTDLSSYTQMLRSRQRSLEKCSIVNAPPLCYTCLCANYEIGRKQENHGTKTKQKLVFRQARLCAVGCRGVGGAGQYLAVPVSGGQVRRRYFSADLYCAGADVRLHDDHGRDCPGPYDPQKPGQRLRCVCKAGTQKRVSRLWRLDQRRYPGADRAVLLGHRRLGHQISV